jgi:uncharacterized protein
MKLRIDDITAEARTLSFSEPQQEINHALGKGALREYELDAPVGVTLSCYRAGAEVFLEGTITAAARANCARCAEEFGASSQRSFRYVLAPRSMADSSADDPRGEDLEFSLYEGDHIDVSPLIQEQVLLALAVRPLCREDCEGLCPSCGGNLNLTACGCRKESVDPRLAVLRNLKVGRA